MNVIDLVDSDEDVKTQKKRSNVSVVKYVISDDDGSESGNESLMSGEDSESDGSGFESESDLDNKSKKHKKAKKADIKKVNKNKQQSTPVKPFTESKVATLDVKPKVDSSLNTSESRSTFSYIPVVKSNFPGNTAPYIVETAKSGRASCKKCKEKINKDDLRIGANRPGPAGDDLIFTSWYHLNCFAFPKKTSWDVFTSKLDLGELSYDQQQTALNVLSSKSDSAANSTPAKRKSNGGGEDGGASSAKKGKVDIEEESMSPEERIVYQKYKAMNVEQLKEYMRWNSQMVTGTKPELIKRCVDGELRGALPSCPQPGCKGRLKLENGKATCPGAFSEDAGVFVRCFFKANVENIKRLAWRSGPKSEEELKAETTFTSTLDTSKYADVLSTYDRNTIEGKRGIVEKLREVCREIGINVPEDDLEAKRKIGSMLLSHLDKSGVELLGIAEEMFGTVQSNTDMMNGSVMGTENTANEGIVKALNELSSVYFKTGNAQAGNTYRKAAAAVREYPNKITSGKAICKGKGKIDGVGEKCGELIDEFLTTGTISKIAEKKHQLS